MRSETTLPQLPPLKRRLKRSRSVQPPRLPPAVRGKRRLKQLDRAASDLTASRLQRLTTFAESLSFEPKMPVLDTGFELISVPKPKKSLPALPKLEIFVAAVALLLALTVGLASIQIDTDGSEMTLVPVEQNDAEQTYRVTDGDTLGTIAAGELGSSRRWKEIVALNSSLESDPNRLDVGVLLKMPKR